MLSAAIIQTLCLANGLNGRGLRPLFFGPPGGGKTAAVESLARAMEALLIPLIASIREPADFLGIPIQDGKGNLVYGAPQWVKEANAAAEKGQIVIVFLDELTTCPLAVQHATLRMLNEGQVGETKLHPNVVFVAAANPPDVAQGHRLTPAMANRWMHLDWPTPTAESWAQGVVSGWGTTRNVKSATEVAAIFDERQKREFPKVAGLVTAFLKRKPSYMHKMPAITSDQASGAWPSHRTWELAMYALTAARAANLGEAVEDMFLEGCVGQAAARELRAFEASFDLPDPAELLRASDPKRVWTYDPSRPDQTVTVIQACVTYVGQVGEKDKERGKLSDAVWRIIGDVSDDATDLAIVGARGMSDLGLSSSAVARTVMPKLGPSMIATGDLKIAGVR